MALLAAALYDPAAAVTKGSAASVMAALDTTNLRLSFTAPANGAVLVRMQGTVHGATTFTQFLLGVMSGSTVVARVAPAGLMNGTALAATFMTIEATFVVPGLTPGASLTWDAAFGVETFVASSLLKYGGPNNTTANDAFGAFLYEIWTTG